MRRCFPTKRQKSNAIDLQMQETYGKRHASLIV
jgi:hypothetical protein